MARLPFIFDEHIIRLDEKIIKDHLKKSFKNRFLEIFKKGRLDEIVKQELANLNQGFDNLNWFFDEVSRQKYCNMNYEVNHDRVESHKITFEADNIEMFKAAGKASFEEENNEKITVIPLKKENEEFNLIIYNHPQIEIPSSGEIEMHYKFNTYMTLCKHANWDTKETYEFTNNPLDTFDINSGYSGIGYTYRLFGEPGKLYYRFGDALFQEYIKSVSTCWRYRRDEKRFKMQGKLYSNEALIYQGSMECERACFPFFLRKDERRNKDNRAVQKVPIGGLNIPVLA